MPGSTLRRLSGILAAALLLASLAGSATPATAERVLRIANMGEPESLDPHKTSTTGESRILRQLFEGLVVHDPQANVAPGAAERWTISEDGLTYTFKLRANAKYPAFDIFSLFANNSMAVM